MSTHEHSVNGKQWICLTGLDRQRDGNLLSAAESLYARLFGDAQREPFSNFESYLRGSARIRQRLSQDRRRVTRYLRDDPVVDTLSLAFSDSTPVGFIFFSWYPNRALVFVSYLGFRTDKIVRESLSWFRTIPQLIEQERSILGLIGKPIEAAVFELEPFDPGEIRRGARFLTDNQASALRRAKLTKTYQRYGSWLIPWVRYRQPPLQRDGRPVPMHLMYWPVDPQGQQDPGEFSSEDIRRLVRFVYERVYLDGYLSTEPKEDGPYWERLMRQYSRHAFKYVPSSVRLERIESGRLGRVFVSYASDQADRAGIIAERLLTRGFPVTIWPNAETSRDGTLTASMDEWIAEASHFVFLVTESTVRAPGQRYEIERVLATRRDAHIEIITDLPPDVRGSTLEGLGFEVGEPRKRVYRAFASKSEFHHALDTVARALVERETPRTAAAARRRVDS